MRSAGPGAATPIVAYPGSRPISVVATDIRITVSASVRLRPIRSPSAPHTNPPSGRAKNATANTASEDSSPAAGSTAGKKTAARVVARTA